MEAVLSSAFYPTPPVSDVARSTTAPAHVETQNHEVFPPPADSLQQEQEAKAIPESVTREAVDAANKTAKLFDSRISFSYDDRIQKVVIKIVQDSTDEIIRQIPPEMMIKMRERLGEGFRGVIFDHKG